MVVAYLFHTIVMFLLLLCNITFLPLRPDANGELSRPQRHKTLIRCKMKVIFVIQGEGREHLTQALALKQMMEREGHEVVKMLVGKSKTRELPSF